MECAGGAGVVAAYAGAVNSCALGRGRNNTRGFWGRAGNFSADEEVWAM